MSSAAASLSVVCLLFPLSATVYTDSPAMGAKAGDIFGTGAKGKSIQKPHSGSSCDRLCSCRLFVIVFLPFALSATDSPAINAKAGDTPGPVAGCKHSKGPTGAVSSAAASLSAVFLLFPLSATV